MKLLDEHKLSPDIIVIDGFVQLNAKSKPGLGMHLFNALKGKVPVIGVAKNPFRGISEDSELLRGGSSKPIYITSVGIPLDKAKEHVNSMSGKSRIPMLLKKVDMLCRRR